MLRVQYVLTVESGSCHVIQIYKSTLKCYLKQNYVYVNFDDRIILDIRFCHNIIISV